MWGRRWMPFPYVRKFILGLTAIGIENAEEAVPVVVRCFFSAFFIRLKKKENPRGHAYLCIYL